MRYHLQRAPHSVVFATTYEKLYNNHKINFDGVNIGVGETRHSSLDWFLVPKERPSIDKASVKEHYIDIPGMNGGLDLTESLTGFPLYDYIEGSFEFIILNDKKLPILDLNGNFEGEKEISWEVLNRDMRGFLNGKKMYMMLEDDPSWYYYGRFTVEKYDSSEASNSNITISYKVYPFKKLSTYTYLDENRNLFFDPLPLNDNDVNLLLSSFWNKSNILLYPGDSKTFSGSVSGELPCGNEFVSLTFHVTRQSSALKLSAKFTNKNGDFTEPIVSDDGTHDVKIRQMLLTNTGGKGNTFSDNVLKLMLDYPTLYSSSNAYKKGACVSLVSAQDYVTWLLYANSDIESNTSLDLTKWDVDVNGMKVKAFSTSTTYQSGELIYILDTESETQTITLYKALHAVESGNEFDPDDWTSSLSTIKKEELYNYISVSVRYDIGVM